MMPVVMQYHPAIGAGLLSLMSSAPASAQVALQTGLPEEIDRIVEPLETAAVAGYQPDGYQLGDWSCYLRHTDFRAAICYHNSEQQVFAKLLSGTMGLEVYGVLLPGGDMVQIVLHPDGSRFVYPEDMLMHNVHRALTGN